MHELFQQGEDHENHHSELQSYSILESETVDVHLTNRRSVQRMSL